LFATLLYFVIPAKAGIQFFSNQQSAISNRQCIFKSPLSPLYCRKIHFVHHGTLKEGQLLIFFPISNPQSAIGNVVIKSSKFPNFLIA